MKITQITVHAGGSFNDPYEDFRNHRPGISITAEFDSRVIDDIDFDALCLQRKADCLYEAERKRKLEARRDEHRDGSRQEDFSFEDEVFDDDEIHGDDEEAARWERGDE